MSGASGMRHAVVTGAASGIGRAVALHLREEGCRITALDLNDPGEVADDWHEIDLDAPGVTLPVPTDPIDVIVNAAGLPPRPGTEAKVLRVNFIALRRATLHFLPHVAHGGAVVNVASKAGARWRENIAQVRRLMAQHDDACLEGFVAAEGIDPVRSYDLSKEAVIAWTKIMTGQLIDLGIRMNCVSPAAIDTPILADFEAAFGERARRGIALSRRAGRPEEVASVIAFLAGPASEWVRGCNVEADGGLAAQLDCETIIGEPAAPEGNRKGKELG